MLSVENGHRLVIKRLPQAIDDKSYILLSEEIMERQPQHALVKVFYHVQTGMPF